jgi:hypothetical protein
MTDNVKAMSLDRLIYGWDRDRNGAEHRNEIRRRAALAGKDIVGYIRDSYARPQAVSSQQSQVQQWRIRDDRHVVDTLTTAHSIYAAVEAMLEGGWDFIDPERRMNKPPREVQNYLEQLRDGPTTSFDELHPSQQGLLRMIRDAWWRAVVAERKFAA